MAGSFILCFGGSVVFCFFFFSLLLGGSCIAC